MRVRSMTKKDRVTFGIVLFMLAVLIMIGPMDVFHHGYFSERPEDVEAALQTQGHTFEQGKMQYSIVAEKRHLEALEIYFEDIPETQTGNIEITLENSTGDEIAGESCSLSDMNAGSWNKIYLSKALSEGESYVFTLSDQEGKIDNRVLLTCGYSESTFTVFGKIFIIVLMIFAGIYAFAIRRLSISGQKRLLKYILIPGALVVLLSWNYFCNPFDSANTVYDEFQQDSDALVRGRIIAKEENIYIGEYGLGYCHDIKSVINDLNEERDWITPITSEEEGFLNGYGIYAPWIVVPFNEYTKNYLIPGNSVLFETGKQYCISIAEYGHLGWYIRFDTTDTLNEETCGNVYNCKILDKDNNELVSYVFVPYQSQYGLQGRVMGIISTVFKYENRVKWMSFLCCVVMAIVVVICGAMLSRKYNRTLACCFFVAFWLSPWIVNFAKCIYWVEFTWLLPFACGLMIANWIEKKHVRRCGYFLVFCSVLIKCLCGYEYVTFVMLGAIWILGVDFLTALCKKDRQNALKIFRVIMITGVAALLGFAVALLLHARLRGAGDIIEGLKSIYINDALRRTLGSDIDIYSTGNLETLNDAFDASVPEVLAMYSRFTTQIITGVDGNMFQFIACAPLFIIGWNLYKKRKCRQDILLYITSFAVSVSWYVLGKVHSHLHPHMNFVSWYYWFVPVCFYIIVKQFINHMRSGRHNKQEECN